MDERAECPFCRVVSGQDGEVVRVHDDELTIGFLHRQPATRGHCLVIPKRHARDLLAIEPEDLAACAAAARRLAGRMGPALGADGVNLLNACGPAAWQTVFHFHLHVVPRYGGDGLQPPWIPAPGSPDEIAAAGELLAG